MLPKSLMAVLCASVAMILVGCAGERFSANDQWWLGLLAVARRHELTEAAWRVLAPLLPRPSAALRPGRPCRCGSGAQHHVQLSLPERVDHVRHRRR
jgi:hypothetical protein